MDTAEMRDALLRPFPAKDVQWRIGSTSEAKQRGLVLAYLDARAVQRRLDEVFGWDGWTAEYRTMNGKGVLCRLSVRVDGGWVHKEDGADTTDIEATKGGISDAFKRVAASGFGIGRYLYDLPSQWVEIEKRGRSWVIARNAIPALPAWALPPDDTGKEPRRATPAPRTRTPDEATEEMREFFDESVGELSPKDMKTRLEDPAWLNDAQFNLACERSGTPETSTDKLNDTEIAALYKAALEVKNEAVGKPPQTPQPPKCPECGADMNDKRKWGGKVAFKCVKSDWDKEAKVERGCSGVIWQTEVDKHPDRYPPVQE